VDLTVLLLTEIEALNRLRQASPTYAEQSPWLERERDNLQHNLQHQFWNENEAQFCNAILRGRITKVTGFPAFIPLLWKKLPLRLQSFILERINESGNLPGGVSILSWRKSALDDRSFPLLHQLLVLEILKETDPNGTLINGFARLIMQGFVEWHALSVGEYGTLKLDAVTAAFIINLQETQHLRIRARGKVASSAARIFRKARIDWFDISVVLACILAIASIRIMYNEWRRPPPFVNLEAEMNTAYASKDVQGTIAAGQMIIRHYPEQSTMAKLMTANMMLLQQQYEEASVLLADVRREYPDSPGPMIALGLAYQLQGRFDEAGENYEEFTYLFDEIFPEIVDMVRQYRYLMDEGFRVPPKWIEIYRYQLMHEL
jgi:hypothetical protein